MVVIDKLALIQFPNICAVTYYIAQSIEQDSLLVLYVCIGHLQSLQCMAI